MNKRCAYLLGADKDYYWFNPYGEKLFGVNWFGNRPDYPSDGLFHCKQNDLTDYARADSFTIVIAAQFNTTLPVKTTKSLSFATRLQR